jgi:hypothetical protein
MATAIASPKQLAGDRALRAPVIPLASWTSVVSGAAVAVSALASALTLFVPGVLRGAAVMNGSGRGTAAVVLFVAVPILATSMYAVARGSVRPVITWLGATAYLLYNSVLFLFLTPFNRLFLLYVAMFVLCFWTVVMVFRSIDVAAFARRYSSALPARAIAVYLAAIAGLNALAWLANVVPAVFNTRSPAFLSGTGLTTNPVYVEDLSFWIPITAIAAVLLWRRQAWGFLLAGTMLVYEVVESISIAVDQWMGSAADPASTVASASVTPIFAAVAAVGLIPLFFYFRHLNRA